MVKSVKIGWYFYKPVMVWCILASLACLYYLLSRQLNIPFAVICKLVSYAAILGLQYLNFKAVQTYFYFRNAGYNISLLYLSVFACDFIAFIVLLSLSTIR
jgi:Na+/H+ antiporter NhaC